MKLLMSVCLMAVVVSPVWAGSIVIDLGAGDKTTIATTPEQDAGLKAKLGAQTGVERLSMMIRREVEGAGRRVESQKRQDACAKFKALAPAEQQAISAKLGGPPC